MLVAGLALAAALAGGPPVPDSACAAYLQVYPSAPLPKAGGEPACGELLAEACDAGRRLACAHLGVLLEEGVVLRRDGPRALAFLERACDAGVGWACGELGLFLLRRGEGERGRAALREGCAIGSGAACTARLADVADPEAARRLAERACDLGDVDGCVALAARTPGGPAPATLDRACRLGSSEACAALGAEGLGKRCDGGDGAACLQLGVLLEEGRVMRAEGAAAAARYERACAVGKAEACWRLGRLHRIGAGVAHDEARARKLLSGACANGEREACRLLGEAEQ
ncbi:MAG: sel1 repeat family protein [Anaeromyxobacter sp.]